MDAVAISLYAKGLTTGEISGALRRGLRRVGQSKDTVSRITDRVVEDMQAWSLAAAAGVYAAVFIDAIYVKVRDGQVGNQPFYAAIGVDLDGHRDVLGLWAGHGGGESAKFWMNVLTDLQQPRRARCVLHRLRRPEGAAGRGQHRVPASHRAGLHHPPDPGHASATRPGKYWEQLAKDLQPIHTARHRGGGLGGVRGAGGEVGQALPGDPEGCGGHAWEEFIPFLAYDVEIRRVLCSTNAIESLNARYRRAVNARGPLPDRAGRPQDAVPGHPRHWTPKAPGRHDGSSGGSRP